MTYMTPSLYPTLRHRLGWLVVPPWAWVLGSLGEGEEPWAVLGEGEDLPDHPEGEERAEENQPPEDTDGSRACGELEAHMRLRWFSALIANLYSLFFNEQGGVI